MKGNNVFLKYGTCIHFYSLFSLSPPGARTWMSLHKAKLAFCVARKLHVQYTCMYTIIVLLHCLRKQ